MDKKKRSHIKEVITEPLVIKDPEAIERLLEVLEQPSNPTHDTKCKPISTEELWKLIDEANKE